MQIIYGNEPYCIDKMKEKLCKDCDVMEVMQLDEETEMFLQTVSFFEEKKKLVIYYPEKAKELKSLSYSWLSMDGIVVMFKGNDKIIDNIVITKNVEAKRFDKYTVAQLRKFILNRIQISDELLNKFISRIDYLKNEDVTLYDVVNEVNKLALVDDPNDKSLDELLGVKNVEGIAFEIGRLIHEGKYQEAVEMAMSCPSGDEMGFIGAMQRYFRVGWKLNYFNSNEVGGGGVVESDFANKALSVLNEAWDSIIAGKLPAKVSLMAATKKITELGGDLCD